jgi:hypothetical protein
MVFAFLFLVYDNIYINMDLIAEGNVYIHPKYKDKVKEEHKKYVINNLVETEWCKYSIVQATINLLKEAYKNKENKWFFLLSYDSYSIYDYNNFKDKFNKIHHNRSIFNYKSEINMFNKIYYNTSQWWILKREDVKIIIAHEHQDFKTFRSICPDEYYFLSILKWNNPDYKYTNLQVMYDVWLTHTIQKSPMVFNCLLKNDMDYIKKQKSLFIRKITPNFSLKLYNPKKKLYVIYIGTETKQHIPENDDFDIIIISAISLDKIDPKIIKRSIYIYNIIYKFVYETILNICNEEYLKNWEIIIFTTEQFNLNHYNSLNKIKKKLPTNNFLFQNGNLENKEQFYYITDDNNNLAFCLTRK